LHFGHASVHLPQVRVLVNRPLAAKELEESLLAGLGKSDDSDVHGNYGL